MSLILRIANLFLAPLLVIRLKKVERVAEFKLNQRVRKDSNKTSRGDRNGAEYARLRLIRVNRGNSPGGHEESVESRTMGY